jgi:hypothetical protein
MAQFIHQYVGELLRRQHTVAQAFPDVIGTDPMFTSRQLYNLNLQTLMILGVIMKVISDVAPQVTDEVWLSRLDAAIDSSPEFPWPQWILDQDPASMG